jgi:hypothetical protein
MTVHPSLIAELEQLRKTCDERFRVHPAKAAQERARETVDEFNAWMEEQLDRIRESDRNLAKLEKKIAKARSDGNVKKHNRLADRFHQAVSDHNVLVETYNRELDERNLSTEAAIERANETVEEYAAWRNEDGPERFGEDLNRFFATLKRAERRGTGDLDAIRRCLDTAREMRADLSAWAVHPDQDPDGSEVVVRATLGGGEDVWLLVDTGATTVTLSPEMVEALGLEKHLGGEIEVRLMAGRSTTARTLVLPSIRVNDRAEPFVRAVAMDVPGAGVDGCLGMTFLNRFDFRVEGGARRRLVLTPRPQSTGHGTGHDVFISHGHEIDPEVPGTVFRRLTDAGRQPFWAAESLPGASRLATVRAVDQALESARHLVVICSSPRALDAGWFAAEWRLFERRLDSAPDGASIVPVLVGEMSEEDLPEALRRFPSVTSGEPGWEHALLDRLPSG